jgi:hypothetical protein
MFLLKTWMTKNMKDLTLRSIACNVLHMNGRFVLCEKALCQPP